MTIACCRRNFRFRQLKQLKLEATSHPTCNISTCVRSILDSCKHKPQGHVWPLAVAQQIKRASGTKNKRTSTTHEPSGPQGIESLALHVPHVGTLRVYVPHCVG